MSDILIKGMEMPTRVLTVEIHPDGYVCLKNGNKVGEAVPVPPHGRLIDADELMKRYGTMPFSTVIVDAPTIIPAEEGE